MGASDKFNSLTWQQEFTRGLAALFANGKLRPETENEILRAARLAYADIALREFVRLVDPSGTRSRWSIACELSARLADFEAKGRQPGDRLGRCLSAILRAKPPRSARRLLDLLPTD